MTARLPGPRFRVLVGWSLLLSVAALAGACGDDGHPPPPEQSSSGGRDGEGGEGPSGSGASGSGASEAGGSGGTANEPGAPSVELHSPEEDAVLTDTLSVSCAVLSDDAEGASPINPSSVQVQLLNDADVVVLEGPASVGGDDNYVAELQLDTVPSGLYTVTCSGADSTSPPLVGRASVSVLVDHGPSIEAINPLPAGYLARAGQHDFEVKIRPVPLFSGDDDAELVGDPILTVDHQEFTLVAKTGGDADVYIVEGIDFENTALFSEPPPDLTDVRVTAENGRSVNGQLDYQVAVDGTGPSITIVAPTEATIIGSRVTFVFQITDDFSGVDWESLVVQAKDIPIPFDLTSSRWTQSGDTATLEINTVDYSVATQMAINVTVADVAGNLSSNGADATYFLDQQPPILALDPPNIRLMDKAAEPDECSHGFDPVGSGAVNPGDVTFNLVLFRAMAWDITNDEPGQILAHWSMVDPASIRLWLAPAGQPLVLDGALVDDVCDEVPLDDVSTVQLATVGVAGTPFFGDGTDDLTNPEIAGYCVYNTPAPVAPAKLCNDVSDMTFAAGQTVDGTTVPAIYAPLVSGGAGCTGEQQSVAALLGDYEGWVCAAVTGQDKAGNASVSAPIAFCMDSPDIAGSPSCATAPEVAPDCTDTCTPRTFPETGFIISPTNAWLLDPNE